MTKQAKLTISPQQVIGEVNDHLYGANLEHLGQAVYGGIWAEMLRDRKFAGCDYMYTAPSEGLHNVHPSIGVVVPWQAKNADYQAVLYAHDNSTFYTGRQSQRITIRQPSQQPRGIKQTGLYLQSERDYELRLVLKGEDQPLHIQLGGESWHIPATASQWQTYRHTFTHTGTHPNGELSLTLTSGTVWIGCASLMPSDHIKGFRADVIAALRDWSPTQLRWPGGNFVSAYHWQNGIGDRDKRPPYLDPAWWLWESNDVGTDEFIDLCRLIDAEPVLTVNMGDGTAEEARAWVEYCNGAPTTPYGALRAANGCHTPHNVQVWFVGNEQFGNWQVGHVDAATYGHRYLDFAAAMRSADDRLTLIGVGVPVDLYAHWNEQVLGIASSQMDQFSLHFYSLRTEKLEKTPAPETLYLPKIAAWHEVAAMLDDTLAIVDRFSAKTLPIAFDEWNTYVGAKPPDFIENYTLADALYTASLMNACLQRADRIQYSAIYHLVNVMGCYITAPLYHWQAVNLGRGGGWVPMHIGDNPHSPAVIKMPATLVLELMTRLRGRQALECKVESAVFSVPAAGNMPAYDDVPLVNAAATCDAQEGRLFVSVVNCSVDAPMQLQLAGIDAATPIEMYTVTGTDLPATNTFDAPQTIQIEHAHTTADKLTLPPHSFTMLVLPTPPDFDHHIRETSE